MDCVLHPGVSTVFVDALCRDSGDRSHLFSNTRLGSFRGCDTSGHGLKCDLQNAAGGYADLGWLSDIHDYCDELSRVDFVDGLCATGHVGIAI